MLHTSQRWTALSYRYQHYGGFRDVNLVAQFLHHIRWKNGGFPNTHLLGTSRELPVSSAFWSVSAWIPSGSSKNDRFSLANLFPSKKNLCKFVKTTATENLAGLYCHRTIPHLRRSPEFSHQPELRISWENPIRVLLLSFYVAIIARAIATVASAFFLFGFLSLSFSLFLRGLREKNEKNAWQHYWWKKSCMVETLQTIRINWCKDLSINSRSANSSTKQTSSSSQLPSNSGTRVGSMSATNCSTKSCFFRSHRYLNERHPVTLIIQRFNLQNALGTPI